MSAPEHTSSISGWFETDCHLLPVRIYYEDTDFSGIVYYANYAKFYERGRTDFLRLRGISHSSLAQGDYGEPLSFAVSKAEFSYKKPATIDDILLVETRVKDLGSARLVLSQSIFQSDETYKRHELLNKADVVVALLDGSFKPRRFPQKLKDQLQNTM